jgi:hypothetical protein
MIIGRLFCDKCGKDCTDLYGFALMTRGTIKNQKTSEELERVKKEFGKSEFVWCWSCTAKAFGSIPVIQEPVQQATIEVKPPKPFADKDNKK